MTPALRRVWPFLYGVAAVIVALICAKVSFDPSAYFTYAHRAHPWSHPTADVAFIIGATLVEGLVVSLCFTVNAARRLWPVALGLLVVLVPWLFLNLNFVVHAPGYRLVHLVWLLALVAALGVTAFTSAALHAFTQLRLRQARAAV